MSETCQRPPHNTWSCRPGGRALAATLRAKVIARLEIMNEVSNASIEPSTVIAGSKIMQEISAASMAPSTLFVPVSV
jgi:hypothetical protein